MGVEIWIMLLMLPYMKGEVQILDYSNSEVITLGTGQTLIQDGDFKLIHMIDISLYEHELRLMDDDINYKIDTYNPLLPFLKHELTYVRDIIRRMKPLGKIKRSIDAIGTAWKWLAGTPDGDDFRLVNERINNSIRQTENQIIINHLIEDKINEITGRMNNIIKDLHSDDDGQRIAALKLKFRLDVLKEEVTNIEQALMWAKSSIINTFLFSEKEVELLRNSTKQQNFPYTNLEQCLKFADLKIATNNTIILYMINLPIVKPDYCKSILIKPIKKRREIVKLDSPRVILCKSKIYEVKGACKSHDDLNICGQDGIKDISNTECVPNLLSSKPAVCKKNNGSHIPSFEVLQPGILFFNSYNGKIIVDGNPVVIDGTFVVTYHNASVTVNNTVYDFFDELRYKPLPAILASPNSTYIFEEKLSLQLIKELHLNNKRYIETLRQENRTSSFLSIGAIGLILITMAYFGFSVWLKRRRSRSITTWLGEEIQKVSSATTVEGCDLRGEELRQQANRNIKTDY